MSFTTSLLGEVLLLRYMLNATSADNVKLHLYRNDYTPDVNTTIGNVTEANNTGYAAATLIGTQWTVASVSGSTCASYANQTFTWSTAEVVYGYYYTNNASSTLIWAERFANAPMNISSGGGAITVSPQICLSDC